MKDYKNPIKATMNKAKDNLLDIADSIYQQGYEAGKADTPFTDTEEAEEKAYNRGLNEAWEAAKKIALMDTETSENVTGYFGLFRIMDNLTASEAIAKIKAYEDKQKQDAEIKVGDEVTTKRGSKGIVITDEPSMDGCISVWLSTCTHVQLYPVKNLSKTGRHFDQIAEILTELRGAENDE